MNDEHQPDTVGRRIGKIARERGIKAKEFERVSGLDRGSVAKLLRGDRGSTSLEAGLKIARFLKIDPYVLLPGGPSVLDAAEAESRLPEGPIAEAVRNLQTELDTVREIAEQALAEAKQARVRGRDKTA